MKCKYCGIRTVKTINIDNKEESKLIIKYGELTYCARCRIKLRIKYLPNEQYKTYWYMRCNNERTNKIS